MITDKKFLIIAGCVILVMLLLVGLAFCQKSDDDFSSLDLLGDGEGDGDESTVGYYRIVLSGECSSEVADAARALEAEIESLTGIDCGVTYDTCDIPNRTDAVEILIGNTNRNSSAVALEGLRAYDYVCKWIDGSLVIGGLSNSATLLALERFVDEVLPYANASELMSADLSFTYHHDYDVDSIKLCGFEISDYSIVCGDETLEFARALANTATQKSGYYIDVRRGTPCENAKEIAFVIDGSADGAAHISYDGEDVIIKAADAYGASVALAKLCSELFGSVAESVDVAISSQITCPYAAPEISVMNVLSELEAVENIIPLMNDALTYIKENSPDVIAFGNINPTLFDTLMLGLPSDYKAAVRSGSGENITVVVYSVQTVSVTCDVTEIDGLSVIKMSVTHNLSGESYESLLVAGSASAATGLSDVIAHNVSDIDNAVVTLMLGDTASDFSVDGLLVKYNDTVYLASSDYKTAIMHGELVTSTSVQLTRNELRSVAFVSVTFCKTYCGDYLKNIQQ